MNKLQMMQIKWSWIVATKKKESWLNKIAELVGKTKLIYNNKKIMILIDNVIYNKHLL